jgi:hypothetical protein
VSTGIIWLGPDTDKEVNHALVRMDRCHFSAVGANKALWGKNEGVYRHLRTGNTTSCGCLRLDRLEQARKRTQLRARKLTHNGRRQGVAAWAKETKNPKQTIYNRLRCKS